MGIGEVARLVGSFVRWVDGYMLDAVRDQLQQNHQMTIQRSVVMITTMTFVVVVVTRLRKERRARNSLLRATVY